MANLSNVVQETTDYDKFRFINSNREQSRGHIEAVKQAFEEYGNLTKVQPILVNDRYEIVDGQHRYTAAKELGQPIHYTVVPGLGVQEARAMNILHRQWTAEDFAHSYAATGNPHYVKYLQLKEEFSFGHAVMVIYIEGQDRGRGALKRFREGNFTIEDLNASMIRLAQLEEVGEYTKLARNRAFAMAYLRIIQNPEYNHSHFIKKLELHGDAILKSYGTAEDNLRQIEEVYNYKMNAGNRVRLY
jgi:hypothetical protein